MRKTILPAACLLMIATLPAASAPAKVLIVDGQNNHDWKSTTPVMKRLLEETGFTPRSYSVGERYRACMEVIAIAD